MTERGDYCGIFRDGVQVGAGKDWELEVIAEEGGTEKGTGLQLKVVKGWKAVARSYFLTGKEALADEKFTFRFAALFMYFEGVGKITSSGCIPGLKVEGEIRMEGEGKIRAFFPKEGDKR